jgi:hypothetical protein
MGGYDFSRDLFDRISRLGVLSAAFGEHFIHVRADVAAKVERAYNRIQSRIKIAVTSLPHAVMANVAEAITLGGSQ